jgi:hypothetical protein
MLANLMRVARQARGEAMDQPLRLLLPIDISPFLEQLGMGGGIADRTGNTVIASVVNLPGGAPVHGDISDVRAATKLAIETAVAQLSATPSARLPGLIDAMHLLPNAITHRIAIRVQADVDGVASNVGPLAEYLGVIGPHVARDIFVVATPMRTDITGTFGRHGETSALSFVADPARLGPAGTLRERVATELRAWGLTAEFLAEEHRAGTH